MTRGARMRRKMRHAAIRRHGGFTAAQVHRIIAALYP